MEFQLGPSIFWGGPPKIKKFEKKNFQRRVLKFKLGVALRALVSYLVDNFELGITKMC